MFQMSPIRPGDFGVIRDRQQKATSLPKPKAGPLRVKMRQSCWRPPLVEILFRTVSCPTTSIC